METYILITTVLNTMLACDDRVRRSVERIFDATVMPVLFWIADRIKR